MKFNRVLKESLRFWPAEVSIEDAKNVRPTENKAYFPTLSSKWVNAETHSENWSEFHKLMTWCIWCAYHRAAVSAYQEQKLSVKKIDIDRLYISQRFFENLRSPTAGYTSSDRRQIK